MQKGNFENSLFFFFFVVVSVLARKQWTENEEERAHSLSTNIQERERDSQNGAKRIHVAEEKKLSCSQRDTI